MPSNSIFYTSSQATITGLLQGAEYSPAGMLSKAECTKTTFPFLFQHSLNILWNVLSLNAEYKPDVWFFLKKQY